MTEGIVMDLDAIIERYSGEVQALGKSESLEEIFEEVDSNISQDSSPEIEDEQLLSDIAGIPDKLAFKIGEVADVVGVKQYVLRYWETEFDILRPKKSRQNQRMYSKKDIENVLLIKKLLYRDKFSIEGARRALRGLKKQVKEAKQWDAVADRYESAIEQLRDLKSEIQRLRFTYS